MSDFIADLERELVAAARRRATRRRRVVLLPRLRPATVLAFVAFAALVVALVAVARGLDGGSHPADERPSIPPGPGVFALPAAEVASPCPQARQRTQSGEAPQPFPLGIFMRPQTEADAVPPLAGADSHSWIPAGTIFLEGARRPSPEQFDAELYLVPAAEPRRGGGCDGELQAELGVCLVVGAGETAVKCFSDDEVGAGRALALTSPGVVHGIAPDGVARVTLDAGGETVSADVHENAYEIPVSAAAGERIQLKLERIQECRPSAELLDSVPALRDGTWQELPATAEDAMPSASVRQWARRIETGDELELWVIAHCDTTERVCVLGVHWGQWTGLPCTTAGELRRHETWLTFPVQGGLGVVGLAPPGTRGVQVVSRGRVHELPFTGGVFGGLLPPSFGRAGDPVEDDLRVRFR